MKMTMFGGLAVGLLLNFLPTAIAQESPRTAPLNFRGRYLVSVSDADMLASAYVDGRLGPREGRDALSVIPLGRHPRELRAYEVEASNSVAGPPNAVAVTPDGRYAFVVETFRPRPDGNDQNQTFADLKQGNLLTVFDLSDPTRPSKVQELTVGERPTAVSVNFDGSLVAVTFHPSGAGSKTPLALFTFQNGRLAQPIFPSLSAIRQGQELIHAEWHPRSNLLALVNNTAAELSFVEVVGNRTVRAWGNIVEIEKSPYIARFTPDGRYVLVNGLYWGADVEGTWNEAPRGSVVSVRLEAGRQNDGTPRHALVSRAETGVSPEGLAVSPNGRYAVTTNLERSYLPYNDPRITWFSSLTLIGIDPQTGRLTRFGEFAYEGILPEAAAFDASSQFLAVVNYDHFDDRLRGGSIDFWRIAIDPLIPQPILVKTPYSIPVTRGVHSMVLVP